MNGGQYCGDRLTGDFPIDAASPFVFKFHHISLQMDQITRFSYKLKAALY